MNGKAYYAGAPLHRGTVAMYRCQNGYRLVGQPRRICQSDNQWSGQEPKCQSITIFDCLCDIKLFTSVYLSSI